MKKTWQMLLLGLLMIFTASESFAQTTPAQTTESHKYRILSTIVGAATGFASGFYVGRAAYDTPDSHSKVWTASAIFASAGGVGGYFIGRVADSRRNGSRIPPGTGKYNVTPLVSKDTKGLQFGIEF
jgi:hypothetical protein